MVVECERGGVCCVLRVYIFFYVYISQESTAGTDGALVQFLL
jgi:hypothetical protein